VDSLKVAILAALNIADEGRRERPDAPSRLPAANERIARMIDRLDRGLAEA